MRNHGHFVLMYTFGMIGLSYSLYMCLSVVIAESFNVDTKLAHNISASQVLGQNLGNAAFNPKLIPNITTASGVLGMAKSFPLLGPGLIGMVMHFVMKLFILCGLEVGVQTVGTIIALIAVLSFGCPALCMAIQGKTIIEVQFPMKEYVQIKPNVYCPLGPGFYSLSYSENLRQLLGETWWLRLLLPTRGAPLDLRPALSPIPSATGATCLRDRIAQVDKDGVERQVATCADLGFNPGPATEPPGGSV